MRIASIRTPVYFSDFFHCKYIVTFLFQKIFIYLFDNEKFNFITVEKISEYNYNC